LYLRPRIERRAENVPTDEFDAVGDQLGEAFSNLDSLVGSLEHVEGLELSDREAVAGFLLRDDLGPSSTPPSSQRG
jgi:hypothetical protein